MNKTMLAILVAAGTCLSALAQNQPSDRVQTKQTAPVPARPVAPSPPVSPEVHGDRRVTFRLRAPAAKEVSVNGEWKAGKAVMSKDEQGIWSATVGPLDADLYGYSFSVDGLQMLDPGNSKVKPMRLPRTSILEVSGEQPLLHDFQNVPHGTVRIHSYQSKSLGLRRNLYVYTPPGYDQSQNARYPTLYLLHGSGDNEATWIALGHAHLIVDNLIAQKRTKPMVIVMTDGHAIPPQTAAASATAAAARTRNVEAFGRDLLEDVMPFVEANYRVRANSENRGIVGLSMGGGQSLTIGLNNPELFAWVGGFSSSVPNPEVAFANVLANPKSVNTKLKLLWFACGKDDFLISNNQQFADLLKTKRIEHTFKLTEGNHSWPVWRRYLAEFAPLLFTGKD